jgi:hypothetical protein
MIIEGYTVGGRFVRPLTRGLAQHYLSSFTVIQRTTRSFRHEGWFSAGGAHPEPQELADFIRGAAAMEQDVVSTVRHIVEYETTLAENEHDAALIEDRLLFLEDRLGTYTGRAARLRHRWLGAERAVATLAAPVASTAPPAVPPVPVTAPPGLFTYATAVLQPGATGAEWMGQGRRTRVRQYWRPVLAPPVVEQPVVEQPVVEQPVAPPVVQPVVTPPVAPPQPQSRCTWRGPRGGICRAFTPVGATRCAAHPEQEATTVGEDGGVGEVKFRAKAPCLNNEFMDMLAGTREALVWTWGCRHLGDVLKTLKAAPTEVEYAECRLAVDLDLRMRLQPVMPRGLQDMPAYSAPRVVRYCALQGSGYLELDLVASHGVQLAKYTAANNLADVVLQDG